MKKILFIIPVIPYPLNSGGNQAFFNMVNYIRCSMSVSVLLCAWADEEKRRVSALSTLWQDVTFFVFNQETSKKSTERSLVQHSFYYKWLGKMKKSIERKMKRQLLHPKNQAFVELDDKDLARERSALYHSVFKGLDAEYVDYVAEIAHSGFDVIQVEFYELIGLGYVLPRDVETVFVHHELRYIRNENEMSFFQRVTSNDSMCFQIAKDFECNALRSYKHVIALTEVDKQRLSSFLEREDCIYASPAVVQFQPDVNEEFVSCVCNRFTFVGFGGHYPNLDAVIWFCEEIAPCLRKLGIKFTLQVVGMGYESYLEELQTICSEMELVGFVDSLPSFLQGSIALVPIRIGSGIRMKILDFVSANIPFITTSKGLEGICFTQGNECLIADTAVDFANAMTKLSGNSQLQEALAVRAKSKLKELYNPQEMLDRRLSVYDSILEK